MYASIFLDVYVRLFALLQCHKRQKQRKVLRMAEGFSTWDTSHILLKTFFHIPIHIGSFVETAKQHFCNPQLSSLFSLDMISLFFKVQLKFSVFHRHKFDLSFSPFSGCFLNGKHKCFPPLIILLDEGKFSVTVILGRMTSWSPLSVLQLVLSLSAASGAHENTTKIFRCVNHYSMLTRYFSF